MKSVIARFKYSRVYTGFVVIEGRTAIPDPSLKGGVGRPQANQAESPQPQSYNGRRQNKMELPASNKSATFEKKPRIPKGYYIGQLAEVKPRQKEDGTPIEGKFGKQIILVFNVYNKETKKPVTLTEGNLTKDLQLAMVLNSTYKDKDGNERTALTPNSRITAVFKALGWPGPQAEETCKTEKYIGAQAEILVSDYDAQWQNDKGQTETYKASAIEKVEPLEGEESPVPTPKSPQQIEAEKPIKVEKTIKHEEIEEEDVFDNSVIEKKIKQLRELKEQGLLTQEGYDQAIEQLNKQRGK